MVEHSPESRPQKLSRKTANAWTRLVGVCLTSEVVAKIKAKEIKVKARKQLFGEQYLDLTLQGAPAEALERCMALAHRDVAALESKIAALRLRREQIQVQVRSKLQRKPHRWDWEKCPAHAHLTPPTEVAEVYFDEVDTDHVAYATPVHTSWRADAHGQGLAK